MTKPRVLVAMSGGVDSSVAAGLLVEQGYDVVGLTMKTWTEDCSDMHQEKCCGPKAITDVRAIADNLGIPCYVLNHEEEFKKNVIDYFVGEYKQGRTPNPCVVCNDKLKFGTVLDKANEVGAEFIATGHYARLRNENARTHLLRGVDQTKDQTYFLFNLKQEQLRRTLFPVGELTKEETRARARQMGLRTHDKPDSQEICFVPDNRYARYLKEQAGVPAHAGDIKDRSGQILGRHDGVEFFTVGQRKGLRISDAQPYYVTGLQPETNTVVVGRDQDLLCPGLIAERPNWIAFESPSQPIACDVKIRYNASAVPAEVSPRNDGKVQVRFQDPQRAITPGQAVVFYRDQEVLGGAWIQKEEAQEKA